MSNETSSKQTAPQQPCPYTDSLPSTGLDIAVVGKSETTKPLATALLRVIFDRKPRRHNGKEDDPAVEALRRHCSYGTANNSIAFRRIHMMEQYNPSSSGEKQQQQQQQRMDHIVWMASSHETLEECLQEAMSHHHQDDIRLQRVSIVLAAADSPPSRRKRKRTGIPIFVLQPTARSATTVARMILQRAKLGTRQTSGGSLPHVSPMVFGTY